jgi:hypothetical protein
MKRAVIASSSPAGRPALLDENPSCGELNGVFFVSKSAFPDENARHTGSNCGVSVARFLPSVAKQSRANSLMLLQERTGGPQKRRQNLTSLDRKIAKPFHFSERSAQLSIDAVAVLHIPGLISPEGPAGTGVSIEHSGDASLVYTMIRFGGHTPDEHALYLRRALGAALDAHDDPRGILFFPDVAEPKGEGYEAIAAEVSRAGIWTPKVGLDHIPARYTSPEAAVYPHDLLTGQMIEVMGRDAALDLDRSAQAGQLNILVKPDRGAGEFQEHLATVSRAMGEDFTARYAVSLHERAEACIRDANARSGRVCFDTAKIASAVQDLENFLEQNGAAKLDIFLEQKGIGKLENVLKPQFAENLKNFLAQRYRKS